MATYCLNLFLYEIHLSSWINSNEFHDFNSILHPDWILQVSRGVAKFEECHIQLFVPLSDIISIIYLKAPDRVGACLIQSDGCLASLPYEDDKEASSPRCCVVWLTHPFHLQFCLFFGYTTLYTQGEQFNDDDDDPPYVFKIRFNYKNSCGSWSLLNSGCEIFDRNSWCGLDSAHVCVCLEDYCIETHQPKGEEQAC